MKRFISLILAFVMVLTAALTVSGADALPFTDVKAKDWFYESVSGAYSRGLMNGVSDTEFAPKNPMTRAMFVTLLANIAGETDIEKADSAFTDVKKSAWYSGYVKWAVDRGYVGGYSDNTFKPNRSITRAEMCVLIYRYLVEAGYSPEINALTFGDKAKIASWASDAVAALAGIGLVAGDSAGNFNPSKNATRAEVATIAVRLVDYIESEGISDNPAETAVIKSLVTAACPKNRLNVIGGYRAAFTREFLGDEIRRLLGLGTEYTVEFSVGDFGIFAKDYKDLDTGGYLQRPATIDVAGPNGGLYRTEMTVTVQKTPEKYYDGRVLSLKEHMDAASLALEARELTAGDLETALTGAVYDNLIAADVEDGALGAPMEISLTSGADALAGSFASAKEGASVKGKLGWKVTAGERSTDGTLSVTVKKLGHTLANAGFEFGTPVCIWVCDAKLGYIDSLKTKLEEGGVKYVDVLEKADVSRAFSGNYGLVIVAGASKAPRGVYDALTKYLEKDGKVLLLGGQLYNGGSDTDVVIDTVSPVAIETYPITNGKTIAAADNQSIVAAASYQLSDNVFSSTPYMTGEGLAASRTFRFVPLIDVRDGKGLLSGRAAWLALFESDANRSGAFEGSAVGCFSSVGEKFYDDAGLNAVADTAKFLLTGSCLVEGGAKERAYFTDEDNTVTFGGSARYNPTTLGTVTLTSRLMKGDAVLAEVTEDLTAKCGNSSAFRTVSADYHVAEQPDRVVTELRVDGVIVDSIEEEIVFCTPEPESAREYVHSEDGNLMAGGKKVTLYGVNYMPACGKADDTGKVHEYYFAPFAYDHDVVENDLDRIADIGFNAVSVFTYLGDGLSSRGNVLDFLKMCEDRGLYVDFSLRNPNENENEFVDLISKHRFADFDIITAYDVNWEGRFGNYAGTGYANFGRYKLDPEWREWLADRYGSIEAAEAVFGTALPRDAGGAVIGIQDATLDSDDAAYSKMVAAYRRFVDDTVSVYWGKIAEKIEKIDKNHMIGFRMTAYGTGSEYMYDFRSLTPTLSVMEPEGYFLAGSSSVDLGKIMMCNLWARYSDPDTPVIWKEFGRSVWSGTNYKVDDSETSAAVGIYRSALDGMLKGYSQGVYCWYYGGGFRRDETSDYGIINPDGSDRAVTGVLREYAPKFKSMGMIPEADTFITVDRDATNKGMYGVHQAISKELSDAMANGKNVRLVNKAEVNGRTVYADEVENVFLADGAEVGPLKYVSGIIRNVRRDGDTVTVTVTNTQDAVWRSGTVKIVSADGSVTYASVDTELGRSDSTDVSFTVSGSTDVRLAIDGIKVSAKYKV